MQTDGLSSSAPPDAEEQIQRLLADGVGWIAAHWGQILVAVIAGLLIAVALRAVRGWGAKLCARSKGEAGWGRIAGRAVTRTTNFFIAAAAAQLVVGYANAPLIVDQTIGFMFTVAAAFQGAIWVREFVLGAIEHRTASEGYHGEALLNAMGLIRLLVSTVLFAIALVVVLDNLGVNVTGLVAGLGVGGIAIGLAAQGIFADLFAALAIIFDRPFRRGDNIQFDDSSGTIEEIGLKSTRIRAFTGEERIISNKALLDKEILNTTRRDHIRIKLPLAISAPAPRDKLATLPGVISEIVAAHGATPARAGYAGLAEGAVQFELEFDFAGDDWSVAHAARDRIIIAILERLDQEGVEIALPSRTNYIAPVSAELGR